MTDHQTIDRPPTLEERIDARLSDWRHHVDLANEALASAMALMLGRADPAGDQLQRYAVDLEEGDQIRWEDGWWNVAAVVDEEPATTVLTLTRCGFAPVALVCIHHKAFVSVRSAQ